MHLIRYESCQKLLNIGSFLFFCFADNPLFTKMKGTHIERNAFGLEEDIDIDIDITEHKQYTCKPNVGILNIKWNNNKRALQYLIHITQPSERIFTSVHFHLY